MVDGSPPLTYHGRPLARLVLSLLFLIAAAPSASAATYPAGFQEEPIVAGLDRPTDRNVGLRLGNVLTLRQR